MVVAYSDIVWARAHYTLNVASTVSSDIPILLAFIAESQLVFILLDGY